MSDDKGVDVGTSFPPELGEQLLRVKCWNWVAQLDERHNVLIVLYEQHVGSDYA